MPGMTTSPKNAFWTACTGAECSCANHNISFDFDGVFGPVQPLLSSPAFHRVLRTNDFPSPAEEATIRAAIMELDARLSVATDLTNNINILRTLYLEQIKHIDELLPKIKGSSEILDSTLTTHKELLSPVRRIPAEILRHIFSFTVEFPGEPHNTVWALELVCKRWRQESLGYPQLWAQIMVVFGRKNYSSIEKKPVLRLAEQLRRAGSAPLSVCLSRSSSDAGGKIPSSILLLLRPSTSRIRELILHMPLHFISVFNPLRGRLLSLRSLTISLRGAGGGGASSTPIGSQKIIAFEACSQLNTISIVDVPNMLEWFVLPWTNVEHFHTFHAHLPCHWSFTNCPSIHDIITFTQKMPQLREWHVCLQSPGMRALQRVERVVYSHLSTLSVRAAGTLIGTFLSHISAPLLENLTIKVCLPSSNRTKKLAPGYIAKVCSDFIQQCKPPLVSLHIEGAVLESDSLACILQAAPTLSEIDLKNCGGLTNKVIESLVVIPGAPINSMLGPRLCNLSISGQLEFDPDTFVEMVESRWEVYPFASIHLCWMATLGDPSRNKKWKEASVSIAEDLQIYCTLGLKLTAVVEEPRMLPVTLMNLPLLSFR